MHYKREKTYMKSCDLSVITYLLHDDVIGWTDNVNNS